MYKKFFILMCFFISSMAHGADTSLLTEAESLFNASKLVCSGISDELSKVSKVSKANTAVTAAGTVAAGGALAVGIKKSQEEKEIDRLIAEICNKGGCSAQGVESMSDEDFFENVMFPMAQITELQERIKKSKKLGNWRTGLMAGTLGTNVASAIISSINRDQTDLIQHVQACNKAVESVNNMSSKLRAAGLSPMENPIIQKLHGIGTWCNDLNIADIEKIEKRMTGVMGTSIAGGVIGAVGTATSATANSKKYTDEQNRKTTSEQDKKNKNALNTTANVMAGANVATGLVGTGLNISLITLTKKLMKQAELCEKVFE